MEVLKVRPECVRVKKKFKMGISVLSLYPYTHCTNNGFQRRVNYSTWRCCRVMVCGLLTSLSIRLEIAFQQQKVDITCC